MKNTIRKIATGGLIALALAVGNKTLAEQTPAIPQTTSKKGVHGVSAEAGWHSKYLGSFGFNMTQVPVIQSSLNASFNAVNFNLWSNYEPGKGLTECDQTISTNIENKNLKITPSATLFTFPSIASNTNTSFAIDVSSKNLPVEIKFYATQAFGKGSRKGQLYQLTAGKAFPLKSLSENLSFNTSATITYNDRYFVDGRGFSVVAGGVNATYDFGNGYSANVGTRAQKTLQNKFDSFFKNDSVFEFSFTRQFK